MAILLCELVNPKLVKVVALAVTALLALPPEALKKANVAPIIATMIVATAIIPKNILLLLSFIVFSSTLI